MADSYKIPFHECGCKYFWYKASKVVTGVGGGVVANECYNLDEAREAVRIFKRRLAANGR